MQLFTQVDVADAEQVKQLKCDIERDIAPVDILINNAGLMPLLSLREGSEIEIERIVKVNITSQFFVNGNILLICCHDVTGANELFLQVTRTFLSGMIERKRGHIVGISSISGKCL